MFVWCTFGIDRVAERERQEELRAKQRRLNAEIQRQWREDRRIERERIDERARQNMENGENTRLNYEVIIKNLTNTLISVSINTAQSQIETSIERITIAKNTIRKCNEEAIAKGRKSDVIKDDVLVPAAFRKMTKEELQEKSIQEIKEKDKKLWKEAEAKVEEARLLCVKVAESSKKRTRAKVLENKDVAVILKQRDESEVKAERASILIERLDAYLTECMQKRSNIWLLLWLSTLRFSEASQFAEASEGFRITFL